jgi:hypothetical protein
MFANLARKDYNDMTWNKPDTPDMYKVSNYPKIFLSYLNLTGLVDQAVSFGEKRSIKQSTEAKERRKD